MKKSEPLLMVVLFVFVVSLSYVLISTVDAKYEKDANFKIVDARR